MASTASARKRARQAALRNARCSSQRSALRTAIKRVVAAIDAADRQGAESAYRRAIPLLNAMCSKGLIHKNKRDRHQSRLNKRLHHFLQQIG